MRGQTEAVAERAPAVGDDASASSEAPAPPRLRWTLERTTRTDRPRWWRDQLRRRMLAGADALTAIVLGGVIVASSDLGPAWILVPLSVALLTAKFLSLYDNDHRSIRHLTVDEFAPIAALVATTVIATMFLVPGPAGASMFVWSLLGGTALCFTLRACVRTLWRTITDPERTLVVGEGEPAAAIRRKIELFGDMHMELKRDVPPLSAQPQNGHDPLDPVLAETDRVVLAWSHADPTLVERLLELCRKHQTKLSVISPFKGRARPASRLSIVADLPVLEYNTWDVPRSTMFMKRVFDVLVGSAALLLTSPVLLAIAIAIKLDDGGPVLFRQARAGKGGRRFTMLKFRSMCADAEDRLGELVDVNALAQPLVKPRPDPRVTRVGKFLRRFSLDELPQLVNVVRGEMSTVGPRPEHAWITERYPAEHGARLSIKPGITGPMQVFGRGELTFEERLAVEIDYIENVSITRDLGLLAQTLPAVVRGTGAF